MVKLIGGDKEACTAEASMGRSVSDEAKIQALALPEIRQAWKQAALDLQYDPEARDAARGAVRDGNLLVAWVLWCLSRPEAEQRRIAAWGLRALERLKDSDEQIDLRKISREDFGSLGGVIDGPDEGHPPRKTGGRVAARQDAQKSRRRTG